MSSDFTNSPPSSSIAAEEYVKAMLELLEGSEPVDVLPFIVSRVRSTIDGLTASDLRTPGGPGVWSIIQVIHHVADSELVFGFNLRMALVEDRPVLPAFDQNLWASRLGYSERSLHEALEQLHALRAANVQLIRGLTTEQLQREAIHAERGVESIDRMIRLATAHDIVHLRQLSRIRSTVLSHRASPRIDAPSPEARAQHGWP